ncbi:Gcd10p family-domain-containing protein [Xylariaceae sp. FL0804]|nr:Gcd10p family-domain-containing protein [Xylariaceae sp. FL0804]
MHSVIQPNAWVAIKLPTGNLRVLQIAPNTTISLGKYGSFPSNLIIHRPYHLTYELQDRQPSENFSRLRIVPASELYSDILSSGTSASSPAEATPAPDAEDADATLSAGVEYALVDPESGAVVAKTDRAELNASARQTLTMEEIEELKKDATDAGKHLIAKLMLSHTAMEQKTEYSLAKYKLLKTKKYIRRFSVLPLDVPLLDHWLLEEKDPTKIMDMREEMVALLGCWANVHFGGEDKCTEALSGRWLVVDDTGGLLVAAMAERMGILYPPERDVTAEDPDGQPQQPEPDATAARPSPPQSTRKAPGREARKRTDDLATPFAARNTITLVHANSQPNLTFLRYYGYDPTSAQQGASSSSSTPSSSSPFSSSPSSSSSSPAAAATAAAAAHPLSRHLITLSWLQLLDPQRDGIFASPLPQATAEELRAWKANRRGTFHRKRRRWARARHAVEGARAGGFAGLVVASAMDPVSVLRHAVPLLAGGAPIAVYSPAVEPLAALADCYSIQRRAAWAADPPAMPPPGTTTTATTTTEEEQQQQQQQQLDQLEQLERWPGSDEFPLNPSLVLGAAVQTSRVRRWQVLPGRTHPLMTSRGGPEGYVFTAWRVRPAEGRVEARGKGRNRKRKAAAGAGAEVPKNHYTPET